MKQTDLKIVMLDITELTPYKNNAKLHPREQIEQIKESIQENGFNDPIAVWGKDNIIVEGHGRYIALRELGVERVPCIRLDHLTEEQRRAYTLTHNKLTMNSGYDEALLTLELEELAELGVDAIGFELEELQGINEPEELEDDDSEGGYTDKVQGLIYEPTGECPEVNELYNMDKTNELISEIESSGVTGEAKEFLLAAATRHTVFNYKNIAEYYAHAPAEVQALFERSALVIIDFDKAIENGFVQLCKEIEKMREGDAQNVAE